MATLKQERSASKLVETSGNIGKAMVLGGYSVETAKSPQKLTKSKSWPQLVEKYLPDTLLAQRHNDLLNKKESIIDYKNGRRVPVLTEQIDTQAVGKGLDLAYKIKNKFPVEKSGGDTNVAIVNIVKFGSEAKQPTSVAEE